MKKIFVLISLILSSNAFASSIWIQGPDASKQDFRNFVRQQPDAQTYTQFLISKLPNQEIPASSLEWAQDILEQKTLPNSFFHDLQEMEERGMVDKTSRAFLIGFLQKVKDKAKGDQEQKIRKILCKWSVFPETNTNDDSCSRSVQSLAFVKEKWPQIDALMLEDQIYFGSEDAVAPIRSDEVYNWKLLSNSSKMISFRGTIQELRGENFRFENLVSGNCDSFSHKLDDLEVVSSGSVYFNGDCTKSLKEPETSRSLHWLEENRSWVIPVGVAVLGALAYQYKDKKLVIEKPSFR